MVQMKFLRTVFSWVFRAICELEMMCLKRMVACSCCRVDVLNTVALLRGSYSGCIIPVALCHVPRMADSSLALGVIVWFLKGWR